MSDVYWENIENVITLTYLNNFMDYKIRVWQPILSDIPVALDKINNVAHSYFIKVNLNGCYVNGCYNGNYLFCYKLSKTDETFVDNKMSRVIFNNYLFKKKYCIQSS